MGLKQKGPLKRLGVYSGSLKDLWEYEGGVRPPVCRVKLAVATGLGEREWKKMGI